MTSSDPVEELFGKLAEERPEYYPGSRHKRKDRVVRPPKKRDVSWTETSQTRILNGRAMELYTIGALARAIKRHPNSVRFWIRNGYIPHAPFRLPSYEFNGKTVPGQRLWSKGMIEALVDLLDENGLLDTPRVEWGDYPDLPSQIRDAMDQVYRSLMSNDNEEE